VTLPAEMQRPVAAFSRAARRTFRSLSVRNYRLWFIGQIVSLSGTWMQAVAQAWLVVELTGSPVDLGLTAALQSLPVLLFGVYGGIVADRFDKRTILIGTQTALMLQALALWLLVVTGAADLYVVWGMAAVIGFVNCIDMPARQSFAFEMVGRDDVTNAVGLNSVILNSSRIVGPAIAGAVIAAAGVSWAFLANAATFLAVLASLLAMRPAELIRPEPVPRKKGQIRAGLIYAWTTGELRMPLLMLAVVSTLAYNLQVLLPLVASDVFASGPGTFGALMSAMGIGALCGALMSAWRHRPGYRWLLVVTAVYGAFTLGVAAAPSVTWALVFLVPLGGSGIAFLAAINALLQLSSRDDMRGRVMALWSIVFFGSTPIGAPIAGFLAANLGTRWALALGGLATLLTVAACLPLARRLHPVEAETPAT